VPWNESVVPGKQWAEEGEHVLPVQKTLSGKPWDFPKAPTNTKSTDKCDFKGRYLNNKGNHVLPCDDLCALESIPNNTHSNVCIVQGPKTHNLKVTSSLIQEPCKMITLVRSLRYDNIYLSRAP